MDHWIAPSSSAQLEATDGAIEFSALARAAGARAQELRSAHDAPPVLFATAAPTRAFVTELLAGLAATVPVVVSAAPLTELETALLRELDPRTRLVLWTSGSSGERKAVQLSEENIVAAIAAVTASLDFPRAPRQHLFLPLHYSFGLIGQLLPALAAGVSTKLWTGFGSFALHGKLHELDGMISAVPSQWLALLAAWDHRELSNAPNVTHVVAAGEALDPALRARLQARFPHARVSANYGLTECASRVLSLDGSSPQFPTAATGRPVGDFAVRVDAAGELQVRGSQVMLGYLPRAANAARFTADGWLRTGDRAELAPDGLVTVTGRLDELAKITGNSSR